MTSTEYYASVDRGNLVRTELDAQEFEAEATYHGWSAHEIALMLRPPLMRTPFQMGKWLVTLVER